MNYIKSLQAENEALKTQLDTLNSRLSDFLAHLQSSKFQGQGNDWISTVDVINWARETRMETLHD